MTDQIQIFDRALLKARLERARRDGPAPFLFERAAQDIADRLTMTLRDFPRAVDLGNRSGAVTEALAVLPNVGDVIAVERIGTPDVVADEEVLPFANESLDLIVSAFALSFVNDLPGALIQCRRALRPDGLFLGVLAGPGTLVELREAFAVAESEMTDGVSPRVAPFVEVRDAGGLLQRAGFALPVADLESVTVRYPTPLHLVRDLRAMGLTNPLVDRLRRPMTRSLFFRAMQVYTDRFSDPDGKVRATFDFVHVSGWAPDESQQKPLRPGSAKMRLADALGTAEHTAGDKAPGPKSSTPKR